MVGEVGHALGIVIDAVNLLVPDAVFIEEVQQRSFAAAIRVDAANAGAEFLARSGTVLLPVKLEPAVAVKRTGPSVLQKLSTMDNFALDKLVIFKGICEAVDLVYTVQSCIVELVKVVVVTVDKAPAGLHLAENEVIQLAVLREQAGILAAADAVSAEVIVEAARAVRSRNLLHTGGLVVLYIVELTAVFLGDPALQVGVVEDEFVGERGVRAGEFGAFVAREVRGVVIRLETIARPQRSSGNVVGLRASQTCLICDGAGVLHMDLVIGVPVRVVAHYALESGDDAQRIRCAGVDGTVDLDPVAGEDDSVVRLIICGVCQLEILAVYLHLGKVHLQPRIDIHCYGDGGAGADTLSQHEEKLPCGGGAVDLAFAHESGDQRQRLRDVLRNVQIVHVQRKGVVDRHGLVRIVLIVGHIVGRGGVRDDTIPRELAVARSAVVEIEARLVGAEQADRAFTGDVHVVPERCCDLRGTDAAIRSGASEIKAEDFAGSRLLQLEEEIRIRPVWICGNQYHVIVIVRGQGQLHSLLVDRIELYRLEGEFVRNDRMDLHAAEDLFALHETDGHVAVVLRHEYVPVHAADRFIAHVPDGVLRQRGRVAGSADANSLNVQLGTGHDIVAFNTQIRVIQLVGDLRRGDDHQRGTDAALKAVGRAIDHSDLIRPFRLGRKGRGAAAVEIHGGDTAGIQHDLRDLFRTAAAGPGLLAAIKHHQHDLAVFCDTDAGTAGAVVHIVRVFADVDLAVSHEHRVGADRFLDLILHVGVIRLAADYRGAVLQDTEEPFVTHAMVLNTLHHQRAGGFAGAHAEEVRVRAHNDIEVLAFMRPCGRSDLIGHALHAPLCAVIVLIAGTDGDVIAVDVRGGDIVSHLLVVSSVGKTDGLRHAGRKRRCLRREHPIVFIVKRSRRRSRFRRGSRGRRGLGRIIAEFRDSRIGADEIRPCIANGFYPFRVLVAVELPLALQREGHEVVRVILMDLITRFSDGAQLGITVRHEKCSASGVIQIRRVVLLKEFADFVAGFIVLRHQPDRVKVGVDVFHIEAVAPQIDAEVILSDVGDTGFKIRGAVDVAFLNLIKQVDEIAKPASEVLIGLRNRGIVSALVVGNVQHGKEMYNLDRVTVGDRHVAEAAKIGDMRSVGLVLCGNISNERLFLRAGNARPEAVPILFHTRTDIVENESISVLTVLCSIIVRSIFQFFETCHKEIIVFNQRLRLLLAFLLGVIL